ncbi:sensor protein fixL [Lachnospiraceae bacterium TWA4]|nr:sensor protein fixL [Lachnospiraceae bacterium TWA4]
MLSRKNLKFYCNTDSKIYLKEGSATDLEFIKTEGIDFICTHPPYANIIKYSKGIKGDISQLEVEEFLIMMKKVAGESYRILKKGKYCAFMMGDIRKYGNVIPLGFKTMNCFLEAGFKVKGNYY